MSAYIVRFAASICLAAVAACANMKPATLNSTDGQQRSDAEVAIVRPSGTELTAIDGAALPKHPDAEHFYYRDIRLPPGSHRLEVRRTWGASVLVSPSGYVGGSRSFDVN